jgi:amino acid transporter
MLSFIGWEAVSHLTGELRDPRRQLPRAIACALAVVVVLYLGLAVATVGVLGTARPSDVPLADLMAAGLGAPGRTVTAALALLLTMGTMNTYVAAATRLAGALRAQGFRACLFPAGCSELGATVNRQGRFARDHGDAFISVEVQRVVNLDDDRRRRLVGALAGGLAG